MTDALLSACDRLVDRTAALYDALPDMPHGYAGYVYSARECGRNIRARTRGSHDDDRRALEADRRVLSGAEPPCVPPGVDTALARGAVEAIDDVLRALDAENS